jgi:hypothetical protein
MEAIVARGPIDCRNRTWRWPELLPHFGHGSAFRHRAPAWVECSATSGGPKGIAQGRHQSGVKLRKLQCSLQAWLLL